MTQHPHVHEGTAQDLVPYLVQHPHQRFRLIELSSENAEMPIAEGHPEEPQNLAKVFSDLIDAAKHVECETPLPPKDPLDVAFRDALQEKYQKMGLKR